MAAVITGRIALRRTPTLNLRRAQAQRRPGKDGDGARVIKRVGQAKVGEKEEREKDTEERGKAKAVARVYTTWI